MRTAIVIFALSLSAVAQMHIAGGERPHGGFATAVGLRMLLDSPKAAYNGIPYCQDLQISGGAPPYTLALSDGALPPGLALESGHPCPVITISASPNPVAVGDTVTYTVTVSGGSGTPIGNVSLWEGNAVVATSGLSGGSVQFTRTYSAAGTHAMKAAYPGDSVYGGDYGGPLTETVQ